MVLLALADTVCSSSLSSITSLSFIKLVRFVAVSRTSNSFFKPGTVCFLKSDLRGQVEKGPLSQSGPSLHMDPTSRSLMVTLPLVPTSLGFCLVSTQNQLSILVLVWISVTLGAENVSNFKLIFVIIPRIILASTMWMVFSILIFRIFRSQTFSLVCSCAAVSSDLGVVIFVIEAILVLLVTSLMTFSSFSFIFHTK